MKSATITRRRRPIPFAERVRFSPHSGDLFRVVLASGDAWFFEVDMISGPWVMYRKWNSQNPLRAAGKTTFAKWRDFFRTAHIEKVKP